MEILQAIGAVLTVPNLLLILAGVIIGLVFGTIPGLNTPIAIAILLPFTFAMGVVPSMSLLLGTYMGGVAGGLISAILLRIPGTAASVATVFDGYPMTLNGRAAEALSIGAFASVFGGIFSAIALLLLTPVLASLAIAFGPWEYFGTVFFGLSLVCLLMRGRMLKGFIATLIGVLIKTVGIDPINGIASRFTFGNAELDAGFDLVVVVIGVFALPEILYTSGKLGDIPIPQKFQSKWFFVPTVRQISVQLGNMFRSSIIGTVIGILPGLGGGPAALIAYAQAKKFSKHPEEFGKGCPDGVAASESANNATTGGALIPMLALGVPGDTVTAILIGAMAIQGFTCGPLLLMQEPVLFRTLIAIVIVANLFMFVVQASTVKWAAKVLQMPRYFLMPLIAVFCILGVISVNNRVFDLYYMFAFVLLGYALDKNGYPLAPLMLGVILGGMVEQNLRRSLSYYGTFWDCLKLPSVGTLFFALGVLLPIISVIGNAREQMRSRRSASA